MTFKMADCPAQEGFDLVRGAQIDLIYDGGLAIDSLGLPDIVIFMPFLNFFV